MVRKIVYSSLALCLLAFGAWYGYLYYGDRISFGTTLMVKDVTKDESLRLISDKKKVRGIDIFILGKIDGKADIYRSYVEKESKYHELKELKPGVVHLRMGGDWDAPDCVIRYVPQGVKSGWLKIRYKFRTF
jgi:hypothetical protein